MIGAGPAGLAAALALSKVGCRVMSLAPAYSPAVAGRDTRTAALLAPSVELLRNLGIWPQCRPAAAPLAAIRIIDATRRLLRAPEVEFRAEELGLEAFGYNIPNAALAAALNDAAAGSPSINQHVTAGVVRLDSHADAVMAATREGQSFTARLAVGADGRRSVCRAAAGIAVGETRGDQAAIACSFAHGAEHRDISNEFHREAGPLTTVPLPGGRESSLVWVERPDVAEQLARLDDEAFSRRLEHALKGALGLITSVSPRALFPLTSLRAESSASGRIALVGEAAHVMPPIGAQGLNLGFRDVAVLADCIGGSLPGNDIGAEHVMQAYDRGRRSDIRERMFAVDLLNRSLLTSFLPVQLGRGLALSALGSVSALRRTAMRFGLGALRDLPPLMRSAS